MAFDAVNLNVIGFRPTSEGHKRVFEYTTSDSKSDVRESSYWKGDQNNLRSIPYFSTGDYVEITANDGNLLSIVGSLTVTQGPGNDFSVSNAMQVIAEDVGTFVHFRFAP